MRLPLSRILRRASIKRQYNKADAYKLVGFAVEAKKMEKKLAAEKDWLATQRKLLEAKHLELRVKEAEFAAYKRPAARFN